MNGSLIQVTDKLTLDGNEEQRILIVTRVHDSMGGDITPVENVVEFVKEAPYFCDILVCVGVTDQEKSKMYLNLLKKECDQIQSPPKSGKNSSFSCQNQFNVMKASHTVHLIDVRPWGGFTHSLNVAVGFAVQNGYDLILFMSLELKATNELVRKLACYFKGCKEETKDNEIGFSYNHRSSLKRDMRCNMTLVVGPCLPGHDFYFHNQFSSIQDVEKLDKNSIESDRPSSLDVLPSSELFDNCSSARLPLRGRTCPWNTMAMWDVGKLALTGFPVIGNGGFYNKYNNEKENAIAIIDNCMIDNNTNNSDCNNTTTEMGNECQHLRNRSVKDIDRNGENNSNNITVTDANTKVLVKGGVEEVSAISLLQIFIMRVDFAFLSRSAKAWEC